jgi:hypothetical protein
MIAVPRQRVPAGSQIKNYRHFTNDGITGAQIFCRMRWTYLAPLLSAMLMLPVMMWPVVSPPGRLSAFPHFLQKYALFYCSQEKRYSPGLSAAGCLAWDSHIAFSFGGMST